jgi:putative NADH-flavin reductase
MKSIHPADVALAVFREFEAPAHHQQIFGIWH